MGTMIAYMTKHGCTEKAAEMLNEHLGGAAELVDLKRQKSPDLSRYDTVIVGGSIHAGKMQKDVRKYLERNTEALLTKRLGLYLCCMEEGDTARKQFDEAFPVELRRHAAATGLFGGEFDFERMNFIERKLIKKVAGIEKSVSRIDEDAIREFALEISRSSE